MIATVTCTLNGLQRMKRNISKKNCLRPYKNMNCYGLNDITKFEGKQFYNANY